MLDDPLSAASGVTAYQDVTLAQLRGLFDQMDFDLRGILEREIRVGDELDHVESEVDGLRDRLAAMGIVVPELAPAQDAPTVSDALAIQFDYDVPLVPAESDFDRLVSLSTARLEQLGIDMTRDPLLQVLPSDEIARSLRDYADEYGDISWDSTDWAVVLGAGAMATLVDIVLVRIPKDTRLRDGKEHAGSPLTKWLNEQSKDIYEEFLKPLEKRAKVPFDASSTAKTGGLVSHMAPINHRLKSLGHDPVAGFFFGVRDLMQATGTYTDNGRIVQVATNYEPVRLIEALLTQVRHLLSDVATPAGLPAPLFTLLQLANIDSPFIRVRAGVEIKATWPEIAQYMYVNGYDLRHFFTMGLTPFVVEATIRMYWLLDSYRSGGSREQRKLEKAKLASMLALGHAIATSGTLLKTGLIYQMNPLALNYNQLLAMAPAAMAWLKESADRDHRISQALEAEWQALLLGSKRPLSTAIERGGPLLDPSSALSRAVSAAPPGTPPRTGLS